MKLRTLLEFDMVSSLKNSITEFEVLLKKTSNKDKQKDIKAKIKKAQDKLKQIEQNSK